MSNQNYPTDLTDSQWEHIKELLPGAMPRGRPRELDPRQVVNAIFYVVAGGIQWRLLPREYPRWQSVYYYFRRWRDSAWLAKLNDELRTEVRLAQGRDKDPSAAIID